MSEESLCGPLNTIDTTTLIKFIDKYATVSLIKEVSYTGFVISIDPLTGSVIMSTVVDGANKTVLIPGHAVQKLSQVEASNLTPPKRKSTPVEAEELIQQRKKKIVSWLSKNLLAVVEQEHSLKIGATELYHPYGNTDVYATNVSMFSSMVDILSKMPNDFEP